MIKTSICWLIITLLGAHEVLSQVNFCHEDHFQCFDGKECRELSDVCDNTDHCMDASDEFNCTWNGYTYCKFSDNVNCGWSQHSVDLVTLDDQPDRLETSLISPPVKSLSKHCTIKINPSGCRNISLSLINDTATQTIKTGDCQAQFEHRIGYVKQGTKFLVNIIGERNNDTLSEGSPSSSIVNSIETKNCNPAKIPFNCDFQDHTCAWLYPINRFNQWQYHSKQLFCWFCTRLDNEAYLYNDQDRLAEIRSPLVPATGDKGVCVVFDYKLLGYKNHLQVTKINLGSDGREEHVWSTRMATGSQSVWATKKLFIKSEVDFDIGFISSAIDGQVQLDNVSLRNGSC